MEVEVDRMDRKERSGWIEEEGFQVEVTHRAGVFVCFVCFVYLLEVTKMLTMFT